MWSWISLAVDELETIARDCLLVGSLLARHPSNKLVYLRDGSVQTIVRVATLR